MPEQDLPTVLESFPPLAQLALGAIGVVGLIIWIGGRKLARPFCALLGIVMGGAAAVLLVPAQGEMVALWAIGGGIVGLIAAWGFFRLWMAAGLALLLALALPASMLVWTGAPLPATEEAQEQLRELADRPLEGEVEADPARNVRDERPRAREGGRDRSGRRDGGQQRPRARDDPRRDADDQEEPPTTAEALLAIAHAQADAARAWWDGLGETTRRTAQVLAGLGTLIGVVLGLARPYFAATLQTALVGSAMILTAATYFVRLYAPDYAGWMPASPRGVVLAMGLITTLGVLAQWTVLPRRADR